MVGIALSFFPRNWSYQLRVTGHGVILFMTEEYGEVEYLPHLNSVCCRAFYFYRYTMDSNMVDR